MHFHPWANSKPALLQPFYKLQYVSAKQFLMWQHFKADSQHTVMRQQNMCILQSLHGYTNSCQTFQFNGALVKSTTSFEVLKPKNILKCTSGLSKSSIIIQGLSRIVMWTKKNCMHLAADMKHRHIHSPQLLSVVQERIGLLLHGTSLA